MFPRVSIFFLSLSKPDLLELKVGPDGESLWERYSQGG